MRAYIALTLLAVAACVNGHGHGGKRKIPQVCEAEFESAKTCMDGALKKEGVDFGAVKACFESSTCKKDGDKDGSSSEEEAEGGSTAAPEPRREFKKCIHEKFGAQMDTCLTGKNLGFTLVEGKGHGGRHHGGHRRHGGHHGGQEKDAEGGQSAGGKGDHHGGKGRGGKHGDKLARLMAKAEKCGVAACVRAAIPANLVNDTAAAKALFCRAKQACPHQTDSPCKQQIHKLRVASCECKQSLNKDSVRDECAKSSGYTPTEADERGGRHGGRASRPSSGDGQQRDCSALPQKEHKDECEAQ